MINLGFFFALLVSFSSQAFNVTDDFSSGFYWKNYPISFTIDENDKEVKENLETLAMDAIEEWESKTGLSLWSLEFGSKNLIRWSKNFEQDTNMDPSTVLAVAIRYTNGPYFVRSEIIINGSHPLNFDSTNLLTTLIHELGHTMGLDHSDEVQAVMAPNLQDPYLGLHNDDIEGINYLAEVSEKRQLTGYISPLAYEDKKVSKPIGCGSIGVVGQGSSYGPFSFLVGSLIGLVRKILKKVKTFF
jgi:hypothetical protein